MYVNKNSLYWQFPVNLVINANPIDIFSFVISMLSIFTRISPLSFQSYSLRSIVAEKKQEGSTCSLYP
jgi:hypothetical protein